MILWVLNQYWYYFMLKAAYKKLFKNEIPIEGDISFKK
jgi:hypothetical protein